MRRRAIVALAALLAAVSAEPAGAHATLESTTPAQGATLDVAPRQVTLRFSEPVEIALGAVDVHDSSAARVRSGAPFHPAGETRAVAVRLPAQLPFGVYTTTYRVVSADSHPVSGGFVFAIGRGSAAPALTVDELLAGRRAGPVTSVAFAVVRAIQFGAIALAVGGFILLILVWLPALAVLATPDHAWRSASDAFAARWRLVMFSAAGAGLLTALLALPLQAATAGGTSVWSAAGVVDDVLATRFGTAYGLAAIAWLAVLTLTSPRIRSVPVIRPASVGATGVALPESGTWGLALAVPLTLLVFLPAMAGHASIREPVPVMLTANALHVAAASAWIGGIAVLLLALRQATRQLEPATRTLALTGVVGRFSTVALASVGTLLLGGIIQSIVELDAPADLLDSAYGRAILVKSALVACLMALGALNRQRTLPALGAAATTGSSPGRPGHALRRALQLEVTLGTAALAATGALAGLPPPASDVAAPWSGSAALGPALAELTVAPAVAGSNAVDLYLAPRGASGRVLEPIDLTVRASLPASGISAIDLRARRAGRGHYEIADAQLAPAGRWRIQIDARVSEFDEYTADFDVAVAEG